jgi:hypothetical protein
MTRGPARLAEGTTVALLPGRLKPREVSIERASHPNRFQSKWLISAYEKIVPSSPQQGDPPTVPTGHSIGDDNTDSNTMRGSR